jgi:hypothetical protein
MTERRGGSDVGSGTDTVAVKQSDGLYKLYGYKWFSSATDADVALTLARIVKDSEGNVIEDTEGVSMFLLKTRRDDGTLNNTQMMKLKNKLGTKSLPTAELLLDGAVAELVSKEGRGIASISHMLTITRIHNAVGSIGGMRRFVMAKKCNNVKCRFFCFVLEFSFWLETLVQRDPHLVNSSPSIHSILTLWLTWNCKHELERPFSLKLFGKKIFLRVQQQHFNSPILIDCSSQVAWVVGV